MEKIQLAIDGMSCQACATRIERVLKRRDGVDEAAVSFAGETAQVTFDPQKIDVTTLIEAIHKTGFNAKIATLDNVSTTVPTPWRLIGLILCMLPFVPGMLAMMVGSHQWMPPVAWQFILASIAQLILAYPFYRGAYGALKAGMANMDVLVALGTTAIWLYSSVMFITNHHQQIYFEAAVMVLTFVSIGKFLEERVKRQSLNSIGLMLTLTPPNVEVWRDGEFLTCPLSAIKIDDELRAKQGDRIAADGVILTGEAFCDESHLTGEAQWVEKKSGDTVLAGSLINNGSVTYRAQALGEATLLGDTIRALAEAQGSKAPIARTADRVAAIFVPVVVGIALITLLVTYLWVGSFQTALMHAVAVLVIACPCALGLATPAAIMAGMGLAARHGIRFQDAAILERAGSLNTIVFDKTGTLTRGEATVADFYAHPNNHHTKDEILSAIATAEAGVSHPLALALVRYAQSQNLPINLPIHDLNVTPGAGVSAHFPDWNEDLSVGNLKHVGMTLPDAWQQQWQSATHIAARLGQDEVVLAVTDTLKDDSRHAIERLKQKQMALAIFSGDHQDAVNAIAQQLTLKDARGGLTPRDKVSALQTLQQQGKHVGMVGDGVNDAAALAAADVGFAMHGGTEIARYSADVILMHHSANQVADAIVIARATLKNIHQNLFFAFIYNMLGIPLAAFGLLNPMIAAAAMALSSLSVLTNALRLKHLKIKD